MLELYLCSSLEVRLERVSYTYEDASLFLNLCEVPNLLIVIGSWLHCGYHLTTSIVAPALLSLPFALSLMGWSAGVLCLIVAAWVTFYSYNLLSLVLEHHAQLGQRQLRFRDMARDILGRLHTTCAVSSDTYNYFYS